MGKAILKMMTSRLAVQILLTVYAIECNGLIPHTYKSYIATTLAAFMYYTSEAALHKQMHLHKWSPFYHSHKNHHQRPSPETGLPPWWLLTVYFIVVLFFSHYKLEFGLVFFTTLLIFLTCYEVCHYLIHSDYEPATELGKRIKDNHLYHHQHPKENYQLLFTGPHKHDRQDVRVHKQSSDEGQADH